ncbi:hypothetical protein EHM92_06585 [bacterium]|nr:MAG: hypothetical protein EHM92_06585 [bacterium]
MNTGQTIVTIAAFVFLTTILVNFYGLVASTGDDISSGQDGILETTIATSYMELAQGLSYDEVTDSSDVAIHNQNALTYYSHLGPDDASEDSIHNFDDFDDFNGLAFDKQPGGTNRIYRTRFMVSYVNPANVQTVVSSKTFVKRMDLKTWRIFPAAGVNERLDTLKTSLIMGYFHFD